jgi:hypothetical protein
MASNYNSDTDQPKFYGWMERTFNPEPMKPLKICEKSNTVACRTAAV